jgi:hypothetical protein
MDILAPLNPKRFLLKEGINKLAKITAPQLIISYHSEIIRVNHHIDKDTTFTTLDG